MAEEITKKQNTITELLFNPFKKMSNNQLLFFGLGIILISGILNTISNTHFDGIFDIHTGKESPFWVFIAEGFINLILITLIFFIIGKFILKAECSLKDILSQQAFARWPLILSSLIALSNSYQDYIQSLSVRIAQNPGSILGPDTGQNILFIISIVIFIIIYIWIFFLMYKSVSRTLKISGIKGVGIFLAGCLIIEILSKLVILNFISPSWHLKTVASQFKILYYQSARQIL